MPLVETIPSYKIEFLFFLCQEVSMDKEKTKEEYLNSISQEEKKRYYKIAMKVAIKKKAEAKYKEMIRKVKFSIDASVRRNPAQKIKERTIELSHLSKLGEEDRDMRIRKRELNKLI